MTPLVAQLDHLEIHSPSPAALAAFYQRALQMEVTRIEEDMFLCAGPRRRVVIAPGAERTLGYIALRLPTGDRLAALRQRLAAAGVAIEASPSPFFDDSAFSVTDPDGNRLVFGHCESDDEVAGMSARLQHLALGTSGIGAMIAFYSDVLGLRISDEVVADDDSLRAAFLRADDEHHMVAIFLAPENSFDHHCYEAGDWNLIRDWADYLAGQDIPLDWGPGRHGPGNNLFFMIRDPDHNWLEISAELETVPAEKPIGRWRHCEKTLNAWGKAYLRS
jgi:catechol 2,3-dioxygenase